MTAPALATYVRSFVEVFHSILIELLRNFGNVVLNFIVEVFSGLWLIDLHFQITKKKEV